MAQMKMKHVINLGLPKGDYRVICSKCKKVFVQEHGSPTTAALESLGFSNVCNECLGEVILETNPKDETPKYDKKHQYPNSSNF